MTTYFGFAVADSMFPDDADIFKRKIEIDEAKSLIENAESCVNSSHTETIKAMTERFGIQVKIPEKPPIVNLSQNDELIVMSVRGLPRLTDRRHYTQDEIAGASFKFSLYTIKQVYSSESEEQLEDKPF